MNYVDDLLAEALITAPGCPETVVERMIRASCMAFYRETFSWRHTTDPIAVIEDVREVDLELPAKTVACRVYWMRLAGEDVKSISPRNILETKARPSGFAVADDRRALLAETLPDRTYAGDGLEANVALAPQVDLDELPDELYFRHREGILYGAQTRLLAMPNVGWGDLNRAMAMSALADAEKTKARREADSLGAPVTRVVRYGGI